jgi:hypothetical protein
MSKIVLNRAELNVLLRSPFGAVAFDLQKRGTRVRNRAKQNLRGAGASGLRAFDTGALTNSVSQEFLLVDGQPVVRVGANTYYAVFIHEGTRKMRARPYLREALNAAR